MSAPPAGAAGPGGGIDLDDLAGLLNREVWSKLRLKPPTGARPLLSASLILIDRSGAEARVLLGRRHDGDRFMPGKYVFPGGRLDPDDRRMAAAGALPGAAQARLAALAPRSPALPRALALTAIRETFEETGLMVAERGYGAPQGAPQGWAAFAAQGAYPHLEPLHFVARATTPPRLPRRYDTIFFAADVEAVSHRVDGMVGPDRELTELVWAPVSQAYGLDLPFITRVVLRELELRLAAGMSHMLPAPWYRVGRAGWMRAQM